MVMLCTNQIEECPPHLLAVYQLSVGWLSDFCWWTVGCLSAFWWLTFGCLLVSFLLDSRYSKKKKVWQFLTNTACMKLKHWYKMIIQIVWTLLVLRLEIYNPHGHGSGILEVGRFLSVRYRWIVNEMSADSWHNIRSTVIYGVDCRLLPCTLSCTCTVGCIVFCTYILSVLHDCISHSYPLNVAFIVFHRSHPYGSNQTRQLLHANLWLQKTTKKILKKKRCYINHGTFPL